MKIFWILLVILLTGCTKSNIEPGLNLHQLEYRVNKSEAIYISEIEYIFSDYDLILYDIQSIRDSTYFYLVERVGSFDIKSYYKEVQPKLNEKGWKLIKKDEYGELYCNNKNQAIGITFPTDKLELDGVNSGYFTYQFFKKLSVTLHYTVENFNIDCKFNNLQVQKVL